MSGPLKVERAGGVLTLSLDRAEKKNALNSAMIDALGAALAEADHAEDVRVVVVRAEGADFCAGADLAELLASADREPAENERDALRLGHLFSAMRRLPQPVLGVVRGRALAGGMGLATACDLVLAADGASFGYPEIQRGFVPAMVMTMLRRLVGERVAFDLVATGRVINAAEAARLGFVTRTIPDDRLEQEGRELAETLASRSRSAVALTKRLLYDLDGKSFDDAIALGARINALSRTTPEFRASIETFLKR